MIGEIILRVMAWAAQAELDSIKRRIEAGVRRAAEEGRFPGRPKALTPDQTATIRLLRRNGQSQSAVARTFGVSRQTVWRAEAVLGTRRTVILLRPAWYRTWWPTTVHPEVPPPACYRAARQGSTGPYLRQEPDLYPVVPQIAQRIRRIHPRHRMGSIETTTKGSPLMSRWSRGRQHLRVVVPVVPEMPTSRSTSALRRCRA